MKENFWIEELNYIKPNYDFEKLLLNLTKKELTEIRKLWDFEGISQLNKSKLIKELSIRITDNLESWILLLVDVVLEYGKYSLIAYSSGPFFILTAVEDAREILTERERRSILDYYIPSKKEVENAYHKGHTPAELHGAGRRF